MLEAIYHPSYLPEIDFFKTQLLVWDNIYRIIPYSVEDTFGSTAIAELWQIPETFVRTINASLPDNRYFEERKYVITNQINELSKKKIDKYCDEDHYYLNTEKVPAWVGELLLKRGLRKKNKYDKWGAKHYLVRKDASDFLMSCIAHNISMDNAMFPLTDKEQNCFMTFGNQIGRLGDKKPDGENIKSIIVGIFDFMVPSGLEKMDIEEVIKIREEYSELRQSLVDIIEELSRSFNIRETIDEKRANERVRYALDKFERDIDKFKKGIWRRMFKNWKTQSLATVLGALAGFIFGGPTVGLSVREGSSFITLLSQIAGKEEPFKTGLTIQYFSKINQKIKNKEFIEGIINYQKLVIG